MEPFILKGDTDYHKERQIYANKIYQTPDMMPHRYVFVLTNRCNLRCSFCFQKKEAIPGAMTADDWIRVSEELPDYAWVTMTGGEPFLAKGFERIFTHIASKFGCNIITNGLLLRERHIDLLLAHPKFKTLSISIDNIGNTLRDVDPKQWEKAEGYFRLFAQKRDALGSQTLLDAKTVVVNENANDLFAIHKYCMETLGCDTHSFQLLKGSPMQHADYMFRLEQMYDVSEAPFYDNWPLICEQLELVRQYHKSTGKKCFLHPKIADLNGDTPIDFNKISYINSVRFSKENYMPCKAMWESVHVNADGHVFPCMAISIGNVKNGELKETIKGNTYEDMKKIIKKVGLVEGCNRCGYLIPKDHLL